MKALPAAFLLLAALPALGDGPEQTPVVVGREGLQRRLARANQALSDAIGRLHRKNRDLAESLKAARDEIDAVREALAAAPETRRFRNEHDRFEHPHREEHRGSRNDVPPPPPLPPPLQAPPPVVYPIQPEALQELLQAIGRESFANGRLRVLEQAAPSNWFLVSQVQQLLPAFNFSRDRLAAVRLLKPRILDPANYFRLYSSFDFANDKAELKTLLSQ